jgi:hypothetical protein
MSGIKPFQNAGSVQEIVHQRIDRDHLTARLKPVGSGAWAAIKTSDNVIVRTLSETPYM